MKQNTKLISIPISTKENQMSPIQFWISMKQTPRFYKKLKICNKNKIYNNVHYNIKALRKNLLRNLPYSNKIQKIKTWNNHQKYQKYGVVHLQKILNQNQRRKEVFLLYTQINKKKSLKWKELIRVTWANPNNFTKIYRNPYINQLLLTVNSYNIVQKRKLMNPGMFRKYLQINQICRQVEWIKDLVVFNNQIHNKQKIPTTKKKILTLAPQN